MSDETPWQMKPIGWMRCDFSDRYETPRQPRLAGENKGIIELAANMNYEQAVIGLDAFSHIWVTFVFHRNSPPTRPIVMIQPPRYTTTKVGVFATRSPHRPNGLGLSCVRLERIEGRRLHVCGFDLLDGTPILDIKPYVPHYDALPNASRGWLDEEIKQYRVILTPAAQAQCDDIWTHHQLRIDRYAQVQLQEHPLDTTRKRIEARGPQAGTLAFREWRIAYHVLFAEGIVQVTAVALV